MYADLSHDECDSALNKIEISIDFIRNGFSDNCLNLIDSKIDAISVKQEGRADEMCGNIKIGDDIVI